MQRLGELAGLRPVDRWAELGPVAVHVDEPVRRVRLGAARLVAGRGD